MPNPINFKCQHRSHRYHHGLLIVSDFSSFFLKRSIWNIICCLFAERVCVCVYNFFHSYLSSLVIVILSTATWLYSIFFWVDNPFNHREWTKPTPKREQKKYININRVCCSIVTKYTRTILEWNNVEETTLTKYI